MAAMDSTDSVSKGCFVFRKERKKGREASGPSLAQWSGKLWYESYKECLSSTEAMLESLEKRVYSSVVEGLIEYVKKCASSWDESQSEIPAATLLTGVNMPDHTSLFATLHNKIVDEVSPFAATLWARDCPSLKTAVEHMCSELMREAPKEEDDDDPADEEDSDSLFQPQKKVKRSHCNLQYLSFWYRTLHGKSPSPQKKRKMNKGNCGKPLVVIIPDFESFAPKVLQEFILLLHAHQKKTPFILVLGVATAVSAVHRSLPYHVSSCLKMKVYHSQPSSSYFNEVLEKVVFCPSQPLHLGGKSFKLLMDVFLFHDFSVMGFIQGYKYCIMQHFYDKDWTVLSCPPSEYQTAAKKLSKRDIESLRKLPSVRKHIESLGSRADQIAWLKDDNFVKKQVEKLLFELHQYVLAFYSTLKCLNILTSDLPGAPLDKHLRNVYAIAFSCDINKSPELKQCMSLLSFLSSDELESKLQEILPLVKEAFNDGALQMSHVATKLEYFITKFKTLWLPTPVSPTKKQESPCKSPNKSIKSPLKSPLTSPTKKLMTVCNRSQFKERLKEMSSQDVKLSPYEHLREEVLTFLSAEVFSAFLISPQTKPLNEVLFFDDVSTVKSHIVGSPRQAVLRGLKDPHFYLDCECCKLTDISDILPTLPDVSIVYKLHLESGKLINMYDWLQSFLTIVDPNSGEDQNEVDPKLQARFTRAVAELQFLGFIKSSRSKTDHVMRLTWC